MGRPNGCNCRCECCCDLFHSAWPDVLNLAATFESSPIAGCFTTPTTTQLFRQRCPKNIVTQMVEPFGDWDGSIDVYAEFVSRRVNVGSCGKARFAIAPFWSSSGGGQTSSVPALWLIHRGGGVAFSLVEGTALLKKTSAISACAPKIVVNGSGLPPLMLPITDSWATIAAAIVSNGFASDHELWFPESFANGWDIATIAFMGADVFLTFDNSAPCRPKDLNAIGALVHNNRFYGGEAKWSAFESCDSTAQDVAYSSAYGFCVRYAASGGDTTYLAPTSPSFLHGSAPFAALAKTRLGTHGPEFLAGLTCRATLAALPDEPQHPKGFPEADYFAPCSDCAASGATMRLETTIPTIDGIPVPALGWAPLFLGDCLPCPVEPQATGATIDKRGIVTAVFPGVRLVKFVSDGPVDTNYPTPVGDPGDLLNYVPPPVPFPMPFTTLDFPDGARLVKSNCEETYRNCPYESVTARVEGLTYPIGGMTGLFSPADNWEIGPTLPVDTVGSIAAPGGFDLGFERVETIGTGLVGGAAGLTYIACPKDIAPISVYLSVASDFTKYLGAFSSGHPLIVNTYETHEFSTESDLKNYRDAINECNNLSVGPFGFVFVRFPLAGATSSGLDVFDPETPMTRNGAAETSEPFTAIYQKFAQTPKNCLNSPGTPYPGEAADTGVLPGVPCDLESSHVQIRCSTVSIDPCGSAVTCKVVYWTYFWKRVPIRLEGEFDVYTRTNINDPFVFDHSSGPLIFKSYYQYGFVEQRIATFSAAVSTDLCLRPNLDKTRTITLTLDNDGPHLWTTGSDAECPGQPIQAPNGERLFLRSPNGTLESSLNWPQIKSDVESAVLPLIPVGTEYGGGSGLVKIIITANRSSVGGLPDPATIAMPNIADWSGATVEVKLTPGFGAHDILNAADTFRYTLPSSFPVDWAGEHELLADTNEPQWVEEVAAAPFVKAMLSPDDWTLTLFAADCSVPVVTQVLPFAGLSGRAEPRRVVARYRLPCNQRQRFDTNGANTLELISCDRSVAEWPLTLKVTP